MEITLSAIKADVGSVGGHTRPTDDMIEAVRRVVAGSGLVVDFTLTNTGDDIAIIMSHEHGVASPRIHNMCWEAFEAGAAVAKGHGLYGAGQDLLKDAPAGNLRGSGPGVAELSFNLNLGAGHRPAESFLIIAGDKCGPGAFNLPLFLTFTDPMHCGGLLLSPKIHQGYTFVIEDMDHVEEDTRRIISLHSPEDNWDIATLLRNIDRYGVLAVYSRAHPEEQGVAASTDRLHNITGKYQGKDDPICIVRNQGIFPASEEVVEPYRMTPLVTGDARGSHTMPLMPMAMNSAVSGFYCHPIVTAVGFSMNESGQFSAHWHDFFGDPAWDLVRQQSQERAMWIRNQGFFGVAMASQEEIAYTGLKDTEEKLSQRFERRPEAAPLVPVGS